jgi:hypothetical protein
VDGESDVVDGESDVVDGESDIPTRTEVRHGPGRADTGPRDPRRGSGRADTGLRAPVRDDESDVRSRPLRRGVPPAAPARCAAREHAPAATAGAPDHRATTAPPAAGAAPRRRCGSMAA